MPKYYVQCGPIEMILNAESPDQAAFSTLDRTLQNHLWVYDDPDLTEQDQRCHVVLEALLHLDPSVRISEQGFDRGDAMLIETPTVVLRWHELMVGIKRLLVAAGLASRTMTTELRVDQDVKETDDQVGAETSQIDQGGRQPPKSHPK